ncbi:MAG: trypsin-like serine protease [Frankiales bacterium]|nr:trypsin-like serine protease [Frankiales bacterium]
MSTAGHCLGAAVGRPQTWNRGAGPAVSTPEGQIGRVVFAENRTSNETASQYDFALIRLDKGVQSSAEIRSLGAPAGTTSDRNDSPMTLRTYGQSAFSNVSPQRDLLAPNTRHQDHVYVHGALFLGDSGAPVVDADGLAVGTVLGVGGGKNSVGVGSVDATNDGAPNVIGRLGPVVQHASTALRVRLTLAQA